MGLSHSQENILINKKSTLLISITLALFMVGCTNIPKSGLQTSQFSALDCVAIGEQLALERVTQEHAAQAKGDSWYVVIPFAVAARYIDASSHMRESELRVILLEEEIKSKDCKNYAG